MRLSYFLEDTYHDLYSNIDKNLESYIKDEDWLEIYFQGQEYVKESTIDFSPPSLFSFDKRLSEEEKTKEDITNVRIIYNHLKNLSPLQATNKYMWTCLAHTTYRKYVIHRWLDDDKYNSYDNETKANRIRRVFFASDGKRSLEANAIARLWWYGFMSHDPNNPSNEYHLTNKLVANTKFCRDFMQTPCCENSTVGKGVLLAVEDFRQTLNDNEGISGYYRYLKKYLNRYAAVTSLDALDEDDVRKLSLDYLNKIRRGNPIMEDDADEDDAVLDYELDDEVELASIT